MKIRQIIKEYETPALDSVDATDTYAPPSKGYAIRVLGPLGGSKQTGTPAATLWYGLTDVFPRDYPPADFNSLAARPNSPQARILDTIDSQGSAVVKSGIASRDLAETMANNLATFKPGGMSTTAPIPMSQIQVISQDLNEVSGPPHAAGLEEVDRRESLKGMDESVAEGKSRLPQPADFESDNDYNDAMDEYERSLQDPGDLDYENMIDEPDDTPYESREKVGNMDADAFDDALARLKKLAGAGPLRTVYDPARRVYKNVPTAVQPAQQPRKARK